MRKDKDDAHTRIDRLLVQLERLADAVEKSNELRIGSMVDPPPGLRASQCEQIPWDRRHDF